MVLAYSTWLLIKISPLMIGVLPIHYSFPCRFWVVWAMKLTSTHMYQQLWHVIKFTMAFFKFWCVWDAEPPCWLLVKPEWYSPQFLLMQTSKLLICPASFISVRI
jgi:hypothetical protein